MSLQPFEQLEKEWADFNSVPQENMVACSTGTSALQLAIASFAFPQGSEIIVPDYTMIACARAVTMAGHTPVFVDCTDYDLTIYWEKIEEAITPRTVAIMPVHIYGRICNMERIYDIANHYAMKIIEDLAEAHGEFPHPNANASCWSFYKNKIVAGEEGGAVCFKGSTNAQLAKQLRCLGFSSDHDFIHRPGGMSARLSNANATLILKSLKDVSHNLEMRKKIADRYSELLPSLYRFDNVNSTQHNWVYDLRLHACAKPVDVIVGILNVQGIAARQGFKSMSTQPEYYSRNRKPCPVSHSMSNRIIYLPIDPKMSEADIERNAKAFLSLLG